MIREGKGEMTRERNVPLMFPPLSNPSPISPQSAFLHILVVVEIVYGVAW